jgi:hypothetical protein
MAHVPAGDAGIRFGSGRDDEIVSMLRHFVPPFGSRQGKQETGAAGPVDCEAQIWSLR